MLTPLFVLGQTVITRHALDILNAADVKEAMDRHQSGDWGDLCPEDRKQNESALQQGHRLFSVYRDRHNQKFYVITEHDRSVTTVLLPQDY